MPPQAIYRRPPIRVFGPNSSGSLGELLMAGSHSTGIMHPWPCWQTNGGGIPVSHSCQSQGKATKRGATSSEIETLDGENRYSGGSR